MAKLIPKEAILYSLSRNYKITKLIEKIYPLSCFELLNLELSKAEKLGVAVLSNKKAPSCLIIRPVKGRESSLNILDELEKKGFKYLFIKNYLIVSPEESVLEKIKNLKNNPRLSLYEILPKSPSVFSKRANPEIKAYLNFFLLRDYLIDESNLFSQAPLSLIKEIEDIKWLILQAEIEDNKLVFNLKNNEQGDWSFYNHNKISGINFDHNQLKDKDLLLMVANGNWQEKIKKWQETIPVFEEEIKKWEALYNFNLEKDVIPLLDKPNIFLVSSSKSHAELLGGSAVDFFKNVEWIFLVQKKVSDESLKKIDEIARQVLAYKLPTEKEKKLPDGSKIKELIADPSKHRFAQMSTNFHGSPPGVYFLQKPEVAFEFAYGNIREMEDSQGIQKNLPDVFHDSSMVVFSNSLKFLEKIFRDSQLSQIIKNLREKFLTLEKKEIFYFGTENEEMIIEDYSEKGKVDIQGFYRAVDLTF